MTAVERTVPEGTDPLPSLTPRSKESLLERAFEEYHRLLNNGEQPDIPTLCARFSIGQHSLEVMLAFDLGVADHPALRIAHVQWPTVGDRCDDFTLLRPLGCGRLARVFLAAEASTGGRLVAVKFSVNGDAEARTLGRLSHPHIVPLLSARPEQSTGLTMACMPYLGSATLEHVLSRLPSTPAARRTCKAAILLDVIGACAQPEDPAAGPVHPRLRKGSYTEGVIHLAVQLAETLAFLHARHVCHRDLKPSNVLLDPSGKPLLLDFNLSASEREADIPTGGTFGYMAPEQLRAFLKNREDGVDERADLFAFAALIYQLLSGTYPYGPIPSDSDPKVGARLLLERLKNGFLPLRRVCPDVERPVAAVLDRCLAVDPADRPSSAAELAVALKRQFAPARRMRRWLVNRPRTTLTAIGLCLLFAAIAAHVWSHLPPYSERAYQRAETAYRVGDYDEAEKHFDEAVQAEPDNPRYRFARSCARLKQSKTLPDKKGTDKLADAYGDLNATTNEVLDSPKLAVKAYKYNREQNPARAITCYDLLGRTGYGSIMVLNNRAYSYIQRKKFDKARIDLDGAARLNPNCQAVFYNRAMLAFYERMDDPRKRSMPTRAVEDIERAIQLGPRTPALYRDAALLYAQSSWDDLRCVPISMDAPIATSVHMWKREQKIERAFAFLRQAIAEGQVAGSITRNPFFQRALQSYPAFNELQQIPPQRTSPPMELRLIDPIDLLP